MTIVDYFIFGTYMLVVLGVGYYFYRKNETAEDYYVGGRNISAGHIGLSIVATDVGGGFSIGLGGLGYAMGLSGSWLLFTGLVGAWLSAVFIIPKIKLLDKKHGMMTYPDFLRHRYSPRVALVAAVISGIGYLGFTSGQILAGAKLMAGSVIKTAPFGMTDLQFSLYVIGVIIVGYTVLGGLKAVIYTDTIQWIILLSGLTFFGVPFALHEVGGLSGLKAALPDGHFNLTNISFIQFFNWFITIVPIWLVAMTLYQRMFATRNVKEAKRAWYIAGVFEYPIMAFIGVILGMFARVVVPGVDPEMGVPMLLKTVLPIGLTGIIVASYFSAIMSTADSCVIASSGNFVNDLLERSWLKNASRKRVMRWSMITTLIVGALAILIAGQFTTVLDAILYAYAFMVSGLFVPTLGAYFWKKGTAAGAFWGMILGGGVTLVLLIAGVEMPWQLDPTFYGIVISAIVFYIISIAKPDETENEVPEVLDA
ncbi:MAG: sodium:solute symporter family protein [Lentisphaeria bacterium]|nr:sodium:solute symporter family protein [Candidatus Neomarinimicrobiota bacterium]MCF7842320.1 sodium:solute symporter family protein [Lentisphaeria bacterium]